MKYDYITNLSTMTLPWPEYIEAIEYALDKKALKKMLPLQPGDLPDTYSDSSKLAINLGYQPSTPVKEGVKQFVEWFLSDFQSMDES